MENKLQKNYEELKKKSELTEKFIKLVDELKLDYKNVPLTKKGMEKAVKKLMKKIDNKLKK